MQKWLVNLLLFLLVGIFLWTRLYRLPETFDLFGDSARDLLELEEWRTTNKPPLLGPHTSAISFNQSAWYFYYLYPFYLISGKSLYTTQIAIVAWYLGWLFIGYLWGKKFGITHEKMLLIWAIIVFHPLLIDQTRTVWNPSMILPLMLAALAIQLTWIKRAATKNEVLGWALLLMFSVGFSYSVIPTVGLMALVGFFMTRQRLWLAASLLVAAIVVNIGTVGYELKYNFLLTKNLPNQQVLQTSTNYWQKIVLLSKYIAGAK